MGEYYHSEDEPESEAGDDDAEISGPGNGEVTLALPGTASDDTSADDPDPGFNDSPPYELLNALIQKYEDHVVLDLEREHFPKAESHLRHLIKYLEERHKAYGDPYDRKKMQEKLTDVQKSCGYIAEAEKVLFALLQKPETKAMDHSGYYKELAELRLNQYEMWGDPQSLQSSAKFAQRSLKLRFGLREEHRSEFLESVNLLAGIYELQGKKLAAEACRGLNLPSTAVNALPSPPASLTSSPSQQSPPVNQWTQSHPHGPGPVDISHLLTAIRDGNDGQVSLLLQHGADMESRCTQGLTLLMHAVLHHRIHVVKILCENGVNVDARDRWDCTALHHAVTVRGGDEIIKILVAWKAEVNACCLFRKTPLHYTIDYGNEAAAKILLGAGAKIDVTDIHGRTPYSFAKSKRMKNLARIFQEHEANNDGPASSSTGGSSRAGFPRRFSSDTSISSRTSWSTSRSLRSLLGRMSI